MIRTIIVDDEIWVIKLIRNLVNWEELGFEIVGEAGDGDSALSLIDDSIGLMITDIRIPGKDGLELIDNARQKNPGMLFITISGYEEFDYARTALELGVVSYLVKPVDGKELEKALLKVKHTLEQASGYIRQKDIDSREYKQEKFSKYILSLIEGDEGKTTEAEELESCLNEGVSERCSVICRYSFIQNRAFEAPKENEEDLKNLFVLLSDTISKEIEPFCSHVITARHLSSLYVLISTEAGGFDMTLEKIISSANRFAGTKLIGTGFRMIVGISRKIEDMGRLMTAVDDADTAVKERIYIKDSNIIQRSVEYQKKNISDVITPEMERKLRRYFETLNQLDAEKAITGMLQTASPLHPKDVFDAAYFTADLFFSAWRSQEAVLSYGGITRETVVAGIDNADDIPDIVQVFSQLITKTEELTSDSQANQNERVARDVKSYIHEHYMEDISLDDICNSIYLSVPYVCSIFKQEEGVTIMNYLTDYRIGVARELLLNKSYHTSDVMQMVGYTDVKYFSKVFKKKMGITPAEYRKMFL